MARAQPGPGLGNHRKVLYFLLDLPPVAPLAFLDRFLPSLAGAWSGFDIVQLRAKRIGASTYVEALNRVREALRGEGDGAGTRPGALIPERTASRGHPLLLANDRLDVALAAAADGVHVGEEDLPPEAIRRLDLPSGFVVGLTCHTLDELRRSPGRGADYAGVGSFFPSPTKPGQLPDPRAALHALPAVFPLPLYAIGGLTLERAREALGHPHIAGVVTSSAIQKAADPAREARAWRELLDGIVAA